MHWDWYLNGEWLRLWDWYGSVHIYQSVYRHGAVNIYYSVHRDGSVHHEYLRVTGFWHGRGLFSIQVVLLHTVEQVQGVL